MKKKLGPLELWKWVAIGAAAGLLYYLHRRNVANAAAQNAYPIDQTPSGGLGPIDPTTGNPYALEAVGSQGKTLGNELGDLASIEALQAGSPGAGSGASGAGGLTNELGDLSSIVGLIQAIQETGLMPGPASNTNSAPATSPGAPQHPYGGVQGPTVGPGKGYRKIPGTNTYIGYSGVVKTAKQAGIKNPGHSVTDHGNGRQSASSSAPHNSRQHHNTAPPSHQRAPRRHRTPPPPRRRGNRSLNY